MNTRTFPSIRAQGLNLILGLGQTGTAAALWCARHGGRLRVLDTRTAPSGLAELQNAVDADRVEYRLGPNVIIDDALSDVQTIVLSPGLSPRDEPVRGLLQAAAQRGIEVISEIELFARALEDLAQQGYKPTVVAVTGTNGKTTVTAMVRRLLEAAGLAVRAAGNIGPAALASLADALAADALPDVWVLELSSFQLASTHRLALDAAVVLNLTQDHLDWHGSMQAYAAAKANVLRMSKVALVNRDDPLVLEMIPALDAMNVRSFGRALPELEGDMGLEDNNGMAWLATADAPDFDPPRARSRRDKTMSEPRRRAGVVKRLMPVDALRVRGMHNAMNALAALALAHTVHPAWAAMLHALRDYVGERHRTEFVRSIAGVDFVNDSKGTNVGATVAALEGMGQTTVLIAGGLGKGQDFAPLAEAVKQHARAVVLIGQDRRLIAGALADVGLPVELADSLESAVARSLELARHGDVVLLSPACASMDMFLNYGQRGDHFIEAVHELAREKGEAA